MAELAKAGRTPAELSREFEPTALADAQLLAHIRTLHACSRGTYGAPRIHAQLVRRGQHVGRKRVARLMRDAGLCGVSRRRWPGTTRSRAGARRARSGASALQRRLAQRAVGGGCDLRAHR
jgi:transposase InsO family protein